MKNPYRIPENNEYMADGAIMTAIFPFAPLSQGISIDKNVLKPRNASLKERLENCGITIGAEIAQLAIYYIAYDIYSTIYRVLK